MRIEQAVYTDFGLTIVVDGRVLTNGEKYTILEMGYAVYLLGENDSEWVRANGDRWRGSRGARRRPSL